MCAPDVGRSRMAIETKNRLYKFHKTYKSYKTYRPAVRSGGSYPPTGLRTEAFLPPFYILLLGEDEGGVGR